MPETAINKRKLRMAMIGGGGDGFIGPLHRKAAALCDDIELVGGAFSSDSQRSRDCGNSLHLSPDRVYDGYEMMLAAEARRPEEERVDFVSIVTPNHLHYHSARLALEYGFHVICDKPVTCTLDEAKSLRSIVRKTGQQFGLTHTYVGYPLLTQARLMVADDFFGTIRKVYVHYPQGWLSEDEESRGNKQAAWRTDPELAGASGCIADIGTHAHHLVEYVTGQEVAEVCAELKTFVPGRGLDDDGAALLRLQNGATGVLAASQVCAGSENDLRIAVYGSHGGFEWTHTDPNTLVVHCVGAPSQVFRAGSNVDYLYPEVRAAFMAPAGHPEGFIEAFAALYRSFADRIRIGTGSKMLPACPGIDEGVRGMEFIAAMLESSGNDGVWAPLSTNDRGVTFATEAHGMETA